MKMKTAKKAFVGVLSAIMTVATISTSLVSVSAEPVTTPHTIDDSILCSITVHKYLMDRHLEYQKEYSAGHKLTEDELKNITDNGTPLNDIEFRAYPLDENGDKIEYKDAVVAKYTADYETRYKQTDTASKLVEMFENDGNGYVSVLSEPTDKNGVTTFKNLFQGEWLVEEVENSKVASKSLPIKLALPFTADNGTDWQYDAHAYPKNTDIGIEKDIQHLGNDHHTARINEEHTWIITTTLPDDLCEYDEYKVVDPIDNRLEYVGISKICAVENSTSSEDVGKETELKTNDYKVTVPTDENKNTLTIELTEEGRKNICYLDGKNVNATKLRIYFETKIEKELKVTDFGTEIPNKAKLVFKNAFGEDKERNSDVPEVHTAGISIYKYDNNSGKALAGAKFKIALTKENAENGVFLKDADGVEDYVAESGTDGYALFEGLIFGTQATPQGAETVVKGQEVSESETEYWVVEVEAPVDAETGISYQRITSPIKVVANSNSYIMENCICVSNELVIIKTGGIKSVPYAIAGIAVATIAMCGALVVLKKRK